MTPRVVKQARKRRMEGEGGSNKIVWSQCLELLWRLRAAWKWDRQALAATLRLYCRSFFCGLSASEEAAGNKKQASWPSALVCCFTAFRSCLDGVQTSSREVRKGSGLSCWWRRAEVRSHDQASTAKLAHSACYHATK